MADIAASVLAKLRNKAKASGISYQQCLQLFVQKEFLRKLSKSGCEDTLILKGGLFIITEIPPKISIPSRKPSIVGGRVRSQRDPGLLYPNPVSQLRPAGGRTGGAQRPRRPGGHHSGVRERQQGAADLPERSLPGGHPCLPRRPTGTQG